MQQPQQQVRVIMHGFANENVPVSNGVPSAGVSVAAASVPGAGHSNSSHMDGMQQQQQQPLQQQQHSLRSSISVSSQLNVSRGRLHHHRRGLSIELETPSAAAVPYPSLMPHHHQSLPQPTRRLVRGVVPLHAGTTQATAGNLSVAPPQQQQLDELISHRGFSSGLLFAAEDDAAATVGAEPDDHDRDFEPSSSYVADSRASRTHAPLSVLSQGRTLTFLSRAPGALTNAPWRDDHVIAPPASAVAAPSSTASSLKHLASTAGFSEFAAAAAATDRLQDAADNDPDAPPQKRMVIPRRLLVHPHSAASWRCCPDPGAAPQVQQHYLTSAPSSAGGAGLEHSLRNTDVLEGRNRFVCGGRILLPVGWRATLATGVLIAAVMLLFLVFPARLLWLRHTDDDFGSIGSMASGAPARLGLALLVSGSMLLILSETFLLRAALRDPGLLPPQRWRLPEEAMDNHDDVDDEDDGNATIVANDDDDRGRSNQQQRLERNLRVAKLRVQHAARPRVLSLSLNVTGLSLAGSSSSGSSDSTSRSSSSSSFPSDYKWCSTCLLHRPPRAVHCSDCQACIMRYDHRQLAHKHTQFRSQRVGSRQECCAAVHCVLHN
jgi:hypothetical protein